MASVQIPQFNGENFSNWKFRILAILEEKGVKKFVENEVDLNDDELRKQDARAKSLIIQGIGDKYLEYIKDAKNAKKMMANLEKMFERKSIFTKLYLKRKLLTMKLSSNESMEEHFVKFDTLIRDIEGTETKLEESDKVCHLLLTLPERYETVITAIETITTGVTLEFVKSRLLDSEMKFKNSKTSTTVNESTFAANSQFECYNCGQKGHKRYECPKRPNNTNRGNNTYRGRARGNNYRRRGYSTNFRGRNQSQKETANTGTEDEIAFLALNASIKPNETSITFIVDSGATEHLVQESLESSMVNVHTLEKEVLIQIANGNTISAKKKGTLKLEYGGTNIILEALIVPKLKYNLLSVNKIISKGKEIIFSEKRVNIIGEGVNLKYKRKGKLYIIDFNVRNDEKCMMTENPDMLWHRRLGHLNKHSLKQLNLPVSKEICEACVKGKATRLPFKKMELPRTRRIGEMIHTDLCGPLNPETNDGKKYFQTIVDDYTHFTKVYLLKTKDEAENNLIEYTKKMKAEFNVYVSRIRCDGGGEFISNEFKKYCVNNGIELEYTITNTPQQNGVSERMNRTLLDKARTMFSETELPKQLWGEAICTAAYQVNRSPTEALLGDIPARRWHGKNDLTKLRVFGCRSWANIIPKRSKLEERAIETRMVGYCRNGYRLWEPKTEKLINARDVRFDESNPIKYTHMEDTEEKDSIKTEENETEAVDNNNEKNEETEQRPRREIKLPEKLQDYELYTAFCLLAGDEDPVNYEEAIQSEEWKYAIRKELKAHETMGTWEQTTLPRSKKAIDTKWVFKTKENGMKKARLVVKGFQEKCETNVYAPVARLSTVRMIISLALQKDWKLRQLDIPTAFLNGELKNDIYIKPPDGINKQNVLKLKRALYGLKDAPRCWNERFDTFAIKNKFKRSQHDFCLYTRENTIMIIFVDDIILTGENIENTVILLKEEFQAKDLGEINNFLGIKIERNANSIKLQQEQMINKILKTFKMEECKNAKTPMETNLQVDNTEERIQVPYRELIGSLMYVALGSRPDIMYSVSYLSQFLDKPNEKVWKAGKRVIRYLKGTKELALTYKKSDDEDQLKAYSDADWAGNIQDRKSVSGCAVYYCDNVTSWFSRKQQSVALSSTEAEYIAAALTTQEIVSSKGIASDLSQEHSKAILLMDNQGAIELSKSYENSKRSKHIEIKYHFIKDLVQKGEINIKHVSSEQNVADIFTKAISYVKFCEFRNKLNIV